MLVIVNAACALIGWFVADIAGLLVGMAIGFVLGFVAIYRVYFKPLREASLQRDYSHLEPKLDDDD